MDRQAYQTTIEPENPNKDRFKYNQVFLKDKHGIFKLIEIILTIICFICVGSQWTFRNSGSGGWINFTLALSLIISTFFFFGYLFNVVPFLPGPWAIISHIVRLDFCLFNLALPTFNTVDTLTLSTSSQYFFLAALLKESKRSERVGLPPFSNDLIELNLKVNACCCYTKVM
ncbi:hypothetical protein ACTXT7_013147 [Hymenolepis weldensis]